MTGMPPGLATLLQGAATLTGDRDAEWKLTRPMSGAGPASMATLLDARLSQFRAQALPIPCYTTEYASEKSPLERCERETGWNALACLLSLHQEAQRPTHTTTSDAPLFGVKDLAILKKLAAVCFAWLIVPLVDAYDQAYAHDGVAEIDDDTAWRGIRDGLSNVVDALAACLAEGPKQASTALPTADLARTDVAVILVRIYMVDILRVLLRVAYGDGHTKAELAQTTLHHMLDASPTLTVLSVLRGVAMPSALSQAKPRIPAFVREHATRLMSVHLLRPEGVRSFLIGMLGANDSDMLRGDVDDTLTEGDALYERLNGIARLLSVPPRGMQRGAYYEAIVPHIFSVVDPSTPPGMTPVHGIHRRAAAFAIMRMYENDANAMHPVLTTCFWDVLGSDSLPTPQQIDSALRRLSALITLAPPSPDWIHALCQPMLHRLWSLDTALHMARHDVPVVEDTVRTRDMQAHDVEQVLHTWLRMGQAEALSTSLFTALERALSDSLSWESTSEGLHFTARPSSMPDVLSHMLNHTLSLDQLAQRIHASDTDKDETHTLPPHLAQSLALPVDPHRVVLLLQKAQRPPLGSALLLLSLDEYRRTQTELASGLTSASHAEMERRSLFFLQLVFHLFDTFGSSLMDGDVERLLQLIDVACAPSHASEPELTNAALQLLLSLLERDPTLNVSSTRLLRVLADRIETYRDAENEETRALSQEVTLALAARAHQAPRPEKEAVARPAYMDVYQEALQYLQDPILPVRAHGLHLLTQLVSTDTRHHDVRYGDELDPALLPAIFDLFLQAIQDDESFLYLNAVQGLAHMAASHRASVLGPLMAMYIGGDKTKDGMAHAISYGQTLSQRETDQRLRIGEAMLQVLQHLGEAAVVEFPRIVEPLLTAIRNPLFSATLRSSFLSILGTCVEISPEAVAASGAAASMVNMSLEIIKLTSELRPLRTRAKVRAHVSGTKDGQTFSHAVDDDHDDEVLETLWEKDQASGVDADPKRPQLRRSALLLLALLVRTSCHQMDTYMDQQQRGHLDVDQPLQALRLPGGGMLPSISHAPSQRTSLPLPTLLVSATSANAMIPVVTYLSQEDNDALARQQAQDVLDEIQRWQTLYVQVAASATP